MTAPIDQAKVLQAVEALGITVADVEGIRRSPFPQAQTMLQALKDRAKKNYKKLAFELHPDRTNNDPVKTDLFKVLGQVLADIEKLQVRPPPPPIVRQQVAVHWVQVARTVATGTSSTTSSVRFHPGHVVIMRPI